MTQLPKSLDEAKILTEVALARKYEQEALDFARSQELKAATARKELAEAQNSEYAAELTRISRDQALRQEGIIKAANHHHHVYEFTTDVSADAVDSCLAQLAIWDRQDSECPFEIVINSPGGSLIAGMSLFDQITAYSKRPWDTRDLAKGTHDTTLVVRGYAASMGAILLQAGDTRVIGPESYMMIHQASTWSKGKIGDLKDEVDFMAKVEDQVTDIFVRRSNEKMTSRRFKNLWDRKDVWLTSSEILSYGFADRIG